MPMSSCHEFDQLDTDETGVNTSKLIKISLINDFKFCRMLAYQSNQDQAEI